MKTVTLPSIRRGYDYAAAFTFPADFLADGETLRAELRQTPSQVVAVAEFAAEREDQTVTLSLTEAQTGDLPTRTHVMDLTLVLDGGAEEPIRDPRFIIPVENHVTRAS